MAIGPSPEFSAPRWPYTIYILCPGRQFCHPAWLLSISVLPTILDASLFFLNFSWNPHRLRCPFCFPPLALPHYQLFQTWRAPTSLCLSCNSGIPSSWSNSHWCTLRRKNDHKSRYGNSQCSPCRSNSSIRQHFQMTNTGLYKTNVLEIVSVYVLFLICFMSSFASSTSLLTSRLFLLDSTTFCDFNIALWKSILQLRDAYAKIANLLQISFPVVIWNVSLFLFNSRLAVRIFSCTFWFSLWTDNRWAHDFKCLPWSFLLPRSFLAFSTLDQSSCEYWK